MEKEYYKNDKLQVKPPADPCACVDTALASGHYGYLNLLKYRLEYRKFKNLHFPFIQPLDSATFSSLFTKSAYGSSMEIIAYQPITLYFDEAGKNSLTIQCLSYHRLYK
ncbi:MAG: hypothetical protein U5L96_20485 [Owenweeksia sp.]|nr:hypothetical protein [Owenweeksia sp.]